MLVISHDDRYYSVADRVIKLDEGQVVGDAKPLAEAAAAQLSSSAVVQEG